ncbi:hypothetical protein BDV97DRAFT_361588 [Delphinella strobiligena]|nr:hypothetical protein BDV97DRAFT_361588 [Delphinella strobiligena]
MLSFVVVFVCEPCYSAQVRVSSISSTKVIISTLPRECGRPTMSLRVPVIVAAHFFIFNCFYTTLYALWVGQQVSVLSCP